MDTTPVMWKLVGYTPEGRDGCHLCGHDIKRLFHVQSSEGKYMVVGSECVESLLDVDDRAKMDVQIKRTNRAGRQWKEQKPAALEGENRESYINRRVAEMYNARLAFNAYISTPHHKIRAKRDEIINKKREYLASLPLSARDKALYDITTEANEWAITDIETRFQANRHDFVNQSAHSIRKI